LEMKAKCVKFANEKIPELLKHEEAWTFEIIDINKVPDKHLTKAVKNEEVLKLIHGGERKIEGLRICQNKDLTIE